MTNKRIKQGQYLGYSSKNPCCILHRGGPVC